MVDVTLEDDYLAVSTLYKTLLKLVKGTVICIDGIDFSTWYHAVTNLGIREVKGVLEYLNLIVDVVIVLGIIYAGLYQVVEIDFGKCTCFLFLSNLDADQTEHTT